MIEKPKLTALHWRVYQFLLEYTQDGKTKKSQADIYHHCYGYDTCVTWNTEPTNHSCHCRWLTRIIDDLNSDLSIDKIIAHNKKYEYWIASKKEADELVAFYDSKIKKTNDRKQIILAKMARHGQGKTVTNRAEPIEGSKAKEFHSTYREEQS